MYLKLRDYSVKQDSQAIDGPSQMDDDVDTGRPVGHTDDLFYFSQKKKDELLYRIPWPEQVKSRLKKDRGRFLSCIIEFHRQSKEACHTLGRLFLHLLLSLFLQCH